MLRRLRTRIARALRRLAYRLDGPQVFIHRVRLNGEDFNVTVRR